MIRDRAWITARIPHQGNMCVLDAVMSWDNDRVSCSASSHRDNHNPLRERNRLGAICAIEYAAQAMAVHAALLIENSASEMTSIDTKPPSAGYLTSARAVQLYAARLDDINSDLTIEVERLSGSAASVLYEFTVRGDEKLLASGRATVVLDITQIITATKLNSEHTS